MADYRVPESDVVLIAAEVPVFEQPWPNTGRGYIVEMHQDG